MINNRKQRLCYVVCYKDSDYLRTLTLVAALKQLPDVELLIVKNRFKGILRYLEVPPKLLLTRLRFKPDVFMVGFRAHEIFWALYPAMTGKPKIFDAFLDMHDWLVNEHHKLRQSSLPLKLIDGYMRWVFGRCRFVLIDTEAHARLTMANYRLPDSKVVAVPVGADEQTFKPQPDKLHKNFEVFFFGNMLPLHGIDYILSAIERLKESGELDNVHFTLAGGRGNQSMLDKIRRFIKSNQLEANLTHLEWIPYKELPKYIASADLCLGGPFGGTGQAQRVISGKTFQFLAMAKPTIIGQIDQTTPFKDKQNCLLVEQASAANIAKAIIWAKDHPAELKQMGRAARQIYERHLSLKVIAKQLQSLLAQL